MDMIKIMIGLWRIFVYTILGWTICGLCVVTKAVSGEEFSIFLILLASVLIYVIRECWKELDRTDKEEKEIESDIHKFK